MQLYELLRRTLPGLNRAKPIICGFSANVDIIFPVAGDDFLRFQDAIECIPDVSRQRPGGNLSTREELVAHAAWFMSRGMGCDSDIPTHHLLDGLTTTAPCFRAVGGTGIQAANCLAHAGFHNIRVHLPVYAPEFDAVLGPGLRISDNNHYYADMPGIPREFSEIHCILDFALGTKIRTTEGIIEAPHSDRIILSSDHCNARLRIAPDFPVVSDQMAEAASLLISGFSSPRGMEDFQRFVGDCETLIRRYRQAHSPGGFLHIEDCYQWNSPHERRRLIADRVWPLVDSLGMNEVEYRELADFFGMPVENLWENLSEIAVRHGLKRVCMHAADRCLVVSRYPLEQEAVAIAAGIIFSSSRAYFGNFAKTEGLERMIEETAGISTRLETATNRTLGHGYLGLEVPTLRGMPVKSCIGLGDAFTAGIVACF